MDATIVLACVAIGTVTEVTSYLLNLWVYDPPWLRILNVVVAFGLVFGWIASALADNSMLIQFVAGAAIGVAYEAANLLFLHAWSFRNHQLLFLHGRPALILGAGIPWGLLPVMASGLAKYSVSQLT